MQNETITLDTTGATIKEETIQTYPSYAIVPLDDQGLADTGNLKSTFIGEYKISEEMTCSECRGNDDEDCEICEGVGHYTQGYTIPWTTTKDIFRDMVKSADVGSNELITQIRQLKNQIGYYQQQLSLAKDRIAEFELAQLPTPNIKPINDLGPPPPPAGMAEETPKRTWKHLVRDLLAVSLIAALLGGAGYSGVIS